MELFNYYALIKQSPFTHNRQFHQNEGEKGRETSIDQVKVKERKLKNERRGIEKGKQTKRA